jgi:hypothetical protein
MDTTTTQTEITFTRVNNDTNGNPRFVCHFLAFLNDKDEAQIKEDFAASLSINPFRLTEFKYDIALQRSRQLGGKKFHNKQYGGGIVFQMYSGQQEEMSRKIREIANR